MTSPPPLLYDTYYHIFNRGNNRENIFIQERNYQHFLKLYAYYIDPIAETFAYCLLKNHFHTMVRIRSVDEILATQTLKVFSVSSTPDKQDRNGKQTADEWKKPLGSSYPSKKFSDFFNAYAKAINKAYGRTGSLFQHPFGRVLVTTNRQLWNVIAYIHQNPQKHQFVEDFRDWKWSSYGGILSRKSTKLSRDIVLGWFGGKDQYIELHNYWVSDAQSNWFVEEDGD
jgi:REP element-mobilizing transposase RayT